MRILIDKDGVLYDLHTIWYKQHNDDYGKYHNITKNDVTTWDTSQPCKDNNCPADIFDYLKDSKLWIDGQTLGNSVDITKKWAKDHELAVITNAANSLAAKPSMDWLQIYYSHIEHVMLTSAGIKHWVIGDILIDDGIHNHNGFQGISILYDQPWNRRDKTLIRARDWNHLDVIINRADELLTYYQSSVHRLPLHKVVQMRLKKEVEEGL